MKVKAQSTPTSNDVSTYRRIRKSIGMLAFVLPLLLILLSLIPFFGTKTQGSISHFYYTNLRELFTGVLFAVGLFLIRYQGHTNKNFFKNDSMLTNIAGVMAFGVALVPTNPVDCETEKVYTLFPFCYDAIGWIHYGFAGLFFVILAIICINVFTIGQKKTSDIPVSALNENKIYRWCGYAMLFFCAMVPVIGFISDFPYWTLIFEALALIAFGISWLIKGRIIGDKGAIGEMLYREHH